jgi:hypothetical protein
MIMNLDRDMFWCGAPTALAISSSASNFSDVDVNVGTDGVAYNRHGHFQLAATSAIGSGDLRCAGVIMNRGDIEDNIPFRVKMFSSLDAWYGVGFVTTAAAQVVADKVRWLGVGKRLDEMVCVRPPDAADPRLTAVFFAGVPGGSNDFVIGGSVQRLLTKSDTYSSDIR